MRIRTTLLAATVLALLAVAASGCGASDEADDGVASLDTGASASAGATTTGAESDDPQEAALEWARCMREHGIDVPDPQVDAGGRLRIRPGRGGFRPGAGDDAEFREARDACGLPFGNARPQLTDEQRQQLQETMLEFARCMRAEGIDMPDPDFSGGGGAFRLGPGRGGFDPDDPDFQAAQRTCQPILQELQETRAGGAP
jgi:hypothetical protein